MKRHYLSACLVALLSHQATAAGQHDSVAIPEFTAEHISALPISSVMAVNPELFLFSNALQQVDWQQVLDSTAPHLSDKLEVLLHYAGYASINPKLLLALMELESGVISNPDKQSLSAPFGKLSHEQGFDAQVKDVALNLSARYYAFQKLRDEGKAKKLPAVNEATVALADLTHTSANKLLDTYQTLFNGESLALKADRNIAFSEWASTQAVSAASFSMSFPWPSGYAWYSGGAHSNTGSGYPYSSLDFNNGSGGWGSNTPWVQAAHGGTVTRYSACNIRVTHSSGYSTQYYHMESLQYNTGDVISAGAWLGRYADDKATALCQGGQSTGPHVHFSLLYNGGHISLHNWYISGYRIDVGNSNYDDNCNRFFFEKNGYRTCAWRALYK
ncbi:MULTISPECIES: M23 family metallopeptidase [unclassified Pseudoalteromonas]|uniref:M23 family metallopeptidase n=1 Tax=unclassified Pseudoalteromonas TaxID=194690 RepID=UPI001F37BD58|nr:MULTISPECIES: M23 family metallopeptidase [unclassified Pseudoalteromonas]MCF2825951.1 M23 family metallopeptidase [Pseudoalteromonas sp. OF5H-5]MCF2829973.1 M23 family metallopeptidase [Pseudoalteromonas sp. DL2-H6]MCF2925390.1 M23 family metallopeptidase [Pseudoalteromonas sp. DL2-H1]